MTRKEELLGLVSDLFKDLNGIRPRGVYDGMSEDELVDVANSLSADIAHEIDHERHMAERAYERFESEVQRTIHLGAGDRETALRWMMEAYAEGGFVDVLDCDPYHRVHPSDVSAFLWQKGLHGSVFEEVLTDELMDVI